jgi:hypothetical protein
MISVNSASYVLPIRKDKIKRRKEIELPQLGRLVKVYPPKRNGNETVIVKTGKFVDCTKKLLMFKHATLGRNRECYSKIDLKLGIYRYEYLD